MPLRRGQLIGYEFDRMVVLFSMVDDQKEVRCAISTSAMDSLDGLARSKPNEREAQFMRLRDRIEDRAARKYVALELEGTPPGIILRSIDFQN
jgi:phage shock protein A